MNKFNKEKAALKALANRERLLHPLRQEQIKSAMLEEILEMRDTDAASAPSAREAFRESRTIFINPSTFLQGTCLPAGRLKPRRNTMDIINPRSKLRGIVGRCWIKYRYLFSALTIFALAGGTVYASGNTLPGDTLYPVKKASEQLQLNFAPSPIKQAELKTRFAEKRSEELDKTYEKPAANPKVKNQARKEVQTAIQTLTETHAKLLNRGNEEAAKSITRTIKKLQTNLEKRQAADRAENKDESQGNGRQDNQQKNNGDGEHANQDSNQDSNTASVRNSASTTPETKYKNKQEPPAGR